jgi:hypothetical protein
MDQLAPKRRDGQKYRPTPTTVVVWKNSMDIADAVVFLFSDAESFILGQVLAVDGAFEHFRGPILLYPESVLDPMPTKSYRGKNAGEGRPHIYGINLVIPAFRPR